MVKKDGAKFVKSPQILKMLPSFYQICFQKQLEKTAYLTLNILIFVVQIHKQVTIESLARLMPYPIMFESRRRNIQRFLSIANAQHKKPLVSSNKIYIKNAL